jgi:hypothetical protein
MVEETEHVVCPLDAERCPSDWQERTTRDDDDGLDDPWLQRGSKKPPLVRMEVELRDVQRTEMKSPHSQS